MGTPETIYGKCPVCGADFCVQSKLGLCVMAALTIGDIFEGIPDEIRNKKLQLKERCQDCGCRIVMVLNDNKIKGFEMGGADFVESRHGTLFKRVDVNKCI